MTDVKQKDYRSALIDITNDGPGKDNWFELGNYMNALEAEAKDREVPYQQVLEERSSQIAHNLKTVFGGWIKQYHRESSELLKMGDGEEKRIKRSVFEGIRQVYNMFGLPTELALDAIKRKNWAELEEAVKYRFDMTFV